MHNTFLLTLSSFPLRLLTTSGIARHENGKLSENERIRRDRLEGNEVGNDWLN